MQLLIYGHIRLQGYVSNGFWSLPFFFFLKLKLSPNCPTLLIIHETPVFPPLCCTEGCACRTLSVAIWFTVNSFPSPPSITSPQFICFFFRTGPRGARNTVTTSWLVFLKAELSDMFKDIHCFFILKKSWRCAAEVNWSVIQSIHPLAYPFQNSQWKWLHLCVASAVEDRFLQTFIWWLPRVQIKNKGLHVRKMSVNRSLQDAGTEVRLWVYRCLSGCKWWQGLLVYLLPGAEIVSHAAAYSLAWNSVLLPFHPADVQLVGQNRKGTCLTALDGSKSFFHSGTWVRLRLSGCLCASSSFQHDTNTPSCLKLKTLASPFMAFRCEVSSSWKPAADIKPELPSPTVQHAAQ